MAIGILLILASQAVAACQLLTDQSWYISRLQLSPLKVVGAEGLLGAAITVRKMLPCFDMKPVGLLQWTWQSVPRQRTTDTTGTNHLLVRFLRTT